MAEPSAGVIERLDNKLAFPLSNFQQTNSVISEIFTDVESVKCCKTEGVKIGLWLQKIGVNITYKQTVEESFTDRL